MDNCSGHPLHDALADAAGLTTAFVGTAACTRAVAGVLTRFGSDLSQRLAPHDVGELLAPVRVGDRRGCLLALQDRAVLAWDDRTLPPGTSTAVLHYPLPVIRAGADLVVAGHPIAVRAVLGADLPALLADVLRGAWAGQANPG
jgi:hypothetical protein